MSNLISHMSGEVICSLHLIFETVALQTSEYIRVELIMCYQEKLQSLKKFTLFDWLKMELFRARFAPLDKICRISFRKL